MDRNEGRQYEEVSLIGNGAYGSVFKGRDLEKDGQFVALKKIRLHINSEEGIPMSTIREISVLRQLERLEHPNIVRLFDVYHSPSRQGPSEMSLILVFEFIDQDLLQYLERCPAPGLGPERIKDLMRQILSGVDFLHMNRVVHRDIKPQNILVTNRGEIKLADFGLARIYAFQMTLTTVVVTLWYRAPEVLLKDSYSSAVDLWSCGCILAELVTRKALMPGQSEIDQLHKIFDVIGLPPSSEWPTEAVVPWNAFRPVPKLPLELRVPGIDFFLKDLLEKLLQFNQLRRIKAHEALQHPYFCDDLDQRLRSYDEELLSDETDSGDDDSEDGDSEDDEEAVEDDIGLSHSTDAAAATASSAAPASIN